MNVPEASMIVMLKLHATTVWVHTTVPVMMDGLVMVPCVAMKMNVIVRYQSVIWRPRVSILRAASRAHVMTDSLEMVSLV